MSRGLGKVERELLDELNHTGMALVAPQNLDASKREARRRAARSLDRKGLAALRRNRRSSVLLTTKKAAEWDADHSERAMQKARNKQEEARHEEWVAWQNLRKANPSSHVDIVDERKGPELSITIKRIYGGPNRVDMLLNDLDAELGRYWRFTLPSERNGAVTICASLMDEPKTY